MLGRQKPPFLSTGELLDGMIRPALSGWIVQMKFGSTEMAATGQHADTPEVYYGSRRWMDVLPNRVARQNGMMPKRGRQWADCEWSRVRS